MRHHFSEQLEAVLDELAELSITVQVAVRRATEALLRGDASTAESVMSADLEVDAHRDRIEEQCFRILSLQQPVAGDLRTIVAALRMVSEIERSGDLATHIAKTARLRLPETVVPDGLLPVVTRMAEIAVDMMGRSAAIIAERDVAGLVELRALDDEMDDLRLAILQQLVSPAWAYGAEPIVDLALISRYYERIGDHAVSVAKRVDYVITGDRP